jgi:uncharacterized membrane protein YhaH (DUF805 family)
MRPVLAVLRGESVVLVVIAIGILAAIYVVACFPIALIARRTIDQGSHAWMAFIPVVNLVLMSRIARTNSWLVLIVLAGVIPIVGQLVVLGLQVYLWIRIGRRFNRRLLSYVAAVVPLIGGWILALSIKREVPVVLDDGAVGSPQLNL